MRKKNLTFSLVVMVVALVAWSPWITDNTAWNGLIDGRGTFSDNLGASGVRKILFDAYVTLDYQCGFVTPDEPAL